jgi:hypothetical protein
MIAALNHALEEAIRRAYELGRVDQSIGWAAEELQRMVAANPGITSWCIMQLYGVPASRWSNIPDWDHALWALANVWCDLHRRLHGHPERELPSSPYSVHRYAIPARDAA